MTIHTTTIHGRCPLNNNWDYYTLTVRTDGFIDIAELESICDLVRGSSKTQEDIAEELRNRLPGDCVMELSGRHSQNTATVVSL